MKNNLYVRFWQEQNDDPESATLGPFASVEHTWSLERLMALKVKWANGKEEEIAYFDDLGHFWIAKETGESYDGFTITTSAD